MRNWMMVCTMDKEGKLMDMQPFLPHMPFNNIIDMALGPDGKLYTLEYGTQWFKQNMDARLSRIDFNGGNRAPIAKLTATPTSGPLPLTVSINAKMSEDPDGDSVSYLLEWAGQKQESKTGTFTVTLDKPGEFKPRIIVTDSKGTKGTAETTVVAGNTPATVSIAIEGNSMFFFPNSSVRYSVSVTDPEDGSTKDKSIAASAVGVADLLASAATRSTWRKADSMRSNNWFMRWCKRSFSNTKASPTITRAMPGFFSPNCSSTVHHDCT
jgi:cytochrome c